MSRNSKIADLYHQLCTEAACILDPDPGIDTSDWKGRAIRLARLVAEMDETATKLMPQNTEGPLSRCRRTSGEVATARRTVLENKKAVIERYRQHKTTMTGLCEEYGVDYKWLAKQFDLWGVPRRRRGHGRRDTDHAME